MLEETKKILSKLNKRWVKVLVITILAISLIAGLVLELYNKVAEKVTSIGGNLHEYYEVEEDGAINISDEKIDEIIKEIEALNMGGLDAINLMGELSEYEGTLEEKTQQAKRKYIREFCEAQAVTQTINYNKSENPNKTYGRVYVNRVGENDNDTTTATTLKYIPYEEMMQVVQGYNAASISVSSLDNFLFIGDSRTEGMEAELETLGNNITAIGVSSSTPGDWASVIKSGQGTVCNTSVILPSVDTIRGISVALGANGTTGQIENMKTVLANLLERYPNVPIFVNSIFYVGTAYTYMSTSEYNSNIDTYNDAIEEFCNTNTNLVYIDISTGLYESGYLKSGYTSDGLHLNSSGNDILVRNIKNAIINMGQVSTQTTTTQTTNTQTSNVNINNIADYFSINDKGEIVVARWTKTVVKKGGQEVSNTTSLTTKPINYKSVISQYTTPLNFFVFLNIITQNPEFVSAVSELVKDSKIQITLMDKTTTNYIKEEYKYTLNTKTKQETSDGNSINNVNVATTSTTTKQTITETTETTITSTTPDVDITYVKTWFCEQTIEYNRKDEDTEPTTYPPTEQDDENEPELGAENSATWKTEQSITVTNQNKTIKFEEGTRGEVIDKTGNKGSQGLTLITRKIDENTTFMGLLDDRFDIPNSSDSRSAGGNLVSGAQWLFQLMQKDSALQNLEQIMRYVLYKYTGDDYGVKELDFSIFDAKEFKSFNGFMYGNTVEEKVWFALRNAGYSEYAVAGVMGNIYGESGFDSAVIEKGNGIGFGLCQWSYGRRTQLESYAASKGVEPSDVDTQIEFLLTEITVGAVGPAQGFANYQLLYYNGYNGDMWINADSPESAAVAFCWSFERPGEPRLDVRTQKAREYYNQYQGMTMPSGGIIIQIADTIHKYMEENSYTYCVHYNNSLEECGKYGKSCGLSTTFEASKQNKKTCCATYVSWVLQEAGHITEIEYKNGANDLKNLLISKGWTQIYSVSELQPGDVLYYNGHIEIYAGDGTVYNAGSGNAIRGSSPAYKESIGNMVMGLRAPD